MLPDRVSNQGPLTYESDALPIALRGPATLLNSVSGLLDFCPENRHFKPRFEVKTLRYCNLKIRISGFGEV